MENNDSVTFSVVVAEEISGARTLGERLTRKIDIDAGVLARNMNRFVEKMKEVLEELPDDMEQFSLEEIEISTEISGNGQIVLWGIGGERGVGGGMKFLFKRKTSQTS